MAQRQYGPQIWNIADSSKPSRMSRASSSCSWVGCMGKLLIRVPTGEPRGASGVGSDYGVNGPHGRRLSLRIRRWTLSFSTGGSVMIYYHRFVVVRELCDIAPVERNRDDG